MTACRSLDRQARRRGAHQQPRQGDVKSIAHHGTMQVAMDGDSGQVGQSPVISEEHTHRGTGDVVGSRGKCGDEDKRGGGEEVNVQFSAPPDGRKDRRIAGATVRGVQRSYSFGTGAPSSAGPGKPELPPSSRALHTVCHFLLVICHVTTSTRAPRAACPQRRPEGRWPRWRGRSSRRRRAHAPT